MSQSYESVKKYLPYFFDVTTNYYYSNPDNKQKILDGGNEMRPSIKEGKYKIFTFADRHRERETNMKIFKNKIEKYSIIDEVNVFNLSDVDPEYIKQNQSLFDDNRIFPWAAKAYLMYKGLQDCDDGDVIFWIDSDVIDLKEDGSYSVQERSGLQLIKRGNSKYCVGNLRFPFNRSGKNIPVPIGVFEKDIFVDDALEKWKIIKK